MSDKDGKSQKASACLDGAVMADVGHCQNVVVETRVEQKRDKWRIAATSGVERFLRITYTTVLQQCSMPTINILLSQLLKIL